MSHAAEDAAAKTTAKVKTDEAARVKAKEQAKEVAGVDISGFTMDGLNHRYILRQDVIINDRATYWHSEEMYFIYCNNWNKQGGVLVDLRHGVLGAGEVRRVFWLGPLQVPRQPPLREPMQLYGVPRPKLDD